VIDWAVAALSEAQGLAGSAVRYAASTRSLTLTLIVASPVPSAFEVATCLQLPVVALRSAASPQSTVPAHTSRRSAPVLAKT